MITCRNVGKFYSGNVIILFFLFLPLALLFYFSRIVAISAHAAVYKAAEYFEIQLIKVVDKEGRMKVG